MKTLFSALLGAAAVACGGSSGNNALSNFEGAAYNTTLTTTISCTGLTPVTANATTTVAFQPGSGSDLQYTSASGCLFKFNVSGNTASLANGPVTCSSTVSGTAVALTLTSYSASTSDGHNLTINAAGTASSGGTTCPLSITGSGTR